VSLWWSWAGVRIGTEIYFGAQSMMYTLHVTDLKRREMV
jgi:hypothetical protein